MLPRQVSVAYLVPKRQAKRGANPRLLLMKAEITIAYCGGIYRMLVLDAPDLRKPEDRKNFINTIEGNGRVIELRWEDEKR